MNIFELHKLRNEEIISHVTNSTVSTKIEIELALRLANSQIDLLSLKNDLNKPLSSDSRANSLRAYAELLTGNAQIISAMDSIACIAEIENIAEDLIEFAEQWEAELAALQSKPIEDAAGILIRPKITVE